LHRKSTIRELVEEGERFERWNNDEQRLFGSHHEWLEIRSYTDGPPSFPEGCSSCLVRVYKCARCNSEHAIRFYSNGTKIDMDVAGDCDEVVVKLVQEG
jgi:hypothetical protein